MSVGSCEAEPWDQARCSFAGGRSSRRERFTLMYPTAEPITTQPETRNDGRKAPKIPSLLPCPIDEAHRENRCKTALWLAVRVRLFTQGGLF